MLRARAMAPQFAARSHLLLKLVGGRAQLLQAEHGLRACARHELQLLRPWLRPLLRLLQRSV